VTGGDAGLNLSVPYRARNRDEARRQPGENDIGAMAARIDRVCRLVEKYF
jgi:hypothetical protein